MRRVQVLGSSGAGKSTFAAALALKLGVPVVHLDAHYFPHGFGVEPDRTAWRETVRHLAAGEAWVIDGNYSSTLTPRLAACDTVVVLDYSRWVRMAGLLSRWWRWRGRRRPELPPACVERWNWEVAQFAWEYRARRLPPIMQRVQAEAAHARLEIFRTRAQAAAWLAAI